MEPLSQLEKELERETDYKRFELEEYTECLLSFKKHQTNEKFREMARWFYRIENTKGRIDELLDGIGYPLTPFLEMLNAKSE